MLGNKDSMGSMDNSKASSMESTTSRSTNYNNRKGSSMMDNNVDNRKRILQTLRKGIQIRHKRLCSNRRHHRRNSSRSRLRDNRSWTRFYNCRRNIFLCLCKPRRWCRSRFLFFRRLVPLVFVLRSRYSMTDNRIVSCCLCWKS